jgi:hypothetical protein
VPSRRTPNKRAKLATKSAARVTRGRFRLYRRDVAGAAGGARQ